MRSIKRLNMTFHLFGIHLGPDRTSKKAEYQDGGNGISNHFLYALRTTPLSERQHGTQQ